MDLTLGACAVLTDDAIRVISSKQQCKRFVISDSFCILVCALC